MPAVLKVLDACCPPQRSNYSVRLQILRVQQSFFEDLLQHRQTMDMLGPSDSQVSLEIWTNLPSSTWQLLWNCEHSVQGSRDQMTLVACNRGHTNFLSHNGAPKTCGNYALPNIQTLRFYAVWMCLVFYPVLTADQKEISIVSPELAVLQQAAWGFPGWGKANLHKQPWWVSFDWY